MESFCSMEFSRRGTNSEKWDTTKEGVLPLFVADMDFPCAQPIVDAIIQRAKHPAYGYTFISQRDKQAIRSFYGRRHGWAVDPDHLLFTPGVVNSMLMMVQALTEPADGILVQPPVYGPFYTAASIGGRRVVKNPLVLKDGRYEMDFDDLAKKLDECKMMLLCSPHNPSGRVWPRETLERVVRLCLERDVYLFVDEIHCDFVYEGFSHTPVLTLEGAERIAACAVSATKTFNIAGLQHSSLVIPDEKMRKKAKGQALQMGYAGGSNLFGIAATTAAYEQGDAWLDGLLKVLTVNRDLAVERLNAMGFETGTPEGSYLVWTDMSRISKDCGELSRLLIEKAGVRLSLGTDFGQEGAGFMRVNLACPTKRLEEALGRIQTIA